MCKTAYIGSFIKFLLLVLYSNVLLEFAGIKEVISYDFIIVSVFTSDAN